ncbi:YSIRK-type signal peptide-containing protein, partial [Streptococcus equi]
MLRKHKQRNYDVAHTKQRFSIKKFKFGAASVLIGLSFIYGYKVSADQDGLQESTQASSVELVINSDLVNTQNSNSSPINTSETDILTNRSTAVEQPAQHDVDLRKQQIREQLSSKTTDLSSEQFESLVSYIFENLSVDLSIDSDQEVAMQVDQLYNQYFNQMSEKSSEGIAVNSVDSNTTLANRSADIPTPVAMTASGTVAISERTINNEVHYSINGEKENGSLDYGRTDYKNSDADGTIHLVVTKWATGATGWGYTDKGPYHGRYILNFFREEFYTQIESITVNGTPFEKEADGALWKVPINSSTFNSGLIGVVTNHDVTIKLKGGQTLGSLGLADTKIAFTTLWVNNEGLADIGGNDSGFILQNNPNIPELPQNTSEGNESYLGAGANGLNQDGTESKDGGFTAGGLTKVVHYDGTTKTISSTVSFKPNQNFLQSNSGWVLYINEVLPKELLKYIDTNNVYLGVSDSKGNITASNPVKITVDPNGEGHISTKDTSEVSILNGDWKKVTEVRSLLDSQVFYGALGQRRSYTIQYKLKPEVSNAEFVEKLNEYIKQNNSQMNFESWLEVDFVDTTEAFYGVRKPDGGKPNKWLQNSYANAFLEVLDTDKDGLYDVVEEELKSNPFVVDTDGDGVPDNVEFLNDKTDLINPKSYLVNKPNIDTKTINANQDQTITGTVSRIKHTSLADNNVELNVTNTAAGNVIVKAYLYEEGKIDYSNELVKGETTIPFDSLDTGNYSISVPAGTFKDGDKIILVASSPDGMNTVLSTEFVEVGAPKVTFNVNEGQWSDGRTENVVVQIKDGSVATPQNPTRENYDFLGWASTKDAAVSEKDILNNLSSSKEVFAVWTPKLDGVVNVPTKAIEGKEVDPYQEVIVPNKKEAVINSPETQGMFVDKNGILGGTPTDLVWGDENSDIYEEQKVLVPVSLELEVDGVKQQKTLKVPVTVQRDTDKDGDPDVTDPDDDNDGASDEEEKNAGTDPKDPTQRPMIPLTPIGGVTSDGNGQTVVEGNPIKDITVTPATKGAEISVGQLPDGLNFDKGTGVISGTPSVTDWGADEESRDLPIEVTVTNPDGSTKTETITITVQRDTDKDGDPDVTDPDDDNDGASDEEEKNAGTDPKDPTQR